MRTTRVNVPAAVCVGAPLSAPAAAGFPRPDSRTAVPSSSGLEDAQGPAGLREAPCPPRTLPRLCHGCSTALPRLFHGASHGAHASQLRGPSRPLAFQALRQKHASLQRRSLQRLPPGHPLLGGRPLSAAAPCATLVGSSRDRQLGGLTRPNCASRRGVSLAADAPRAARIYRCKHCKTKSPHRVK